MGVFFHKEQVYTSSYSFYPIEHQRESLKEQKIRTKLHKSCKVAKESLGYNLLLGLFQTNQSQTDYLLIVHVKKQI